MSYNDGAKGILNVLQHFNLHGISEHSTSTGNKKRIIQMNRKSSEPVKKRRKKLRGIQKGYIDTEKATEGKESYIAGGY